MKLGYELTKGTLEIILKLEAKRLIQYICLIKTFPLKKAFCFHLLLCLLSIATNAQNPYFYTIDKTTGLPSNTVYDIFQDQKGLMWFATNEGLCKYDGTKFKVYTNPKQTSKSGSNILQDNFNRIWYINFDGYLYYVENENLHPFNNKNSIGFYEFGIIENKLFTIQEDFIIIYDLKDLKILKKIPFQKTNFKATYLAKDGFYVFTTELLKIDSKLNINHITLPNELIETKSIVAQSKEDILYIISKIDGNLFQYQNNQFKRVATSKGSIIQNLNIVDNQLWLSTTNGLSIYKNKLFKNYFVKNNISGIYKDKENKYWISTLNNGLFYIPNFSTILWKKENKPISLFSDGNSILVGYENDEVAEFSENSFTENVICKGNTNHEVYRIFKDKNNYFFTSNIFKVQTHNKITEINLAVKDIVKVDAKYYAIAASGLCGLLFLKDNTNSIWDVFCKKNGKLENNNFKGSILLQNVRGKAVAYNPSNQTIYFATNKGFFGQNPKKLFKIKHHNQEVFPQKIFYYSNYVYLFTNENEILQLDTSNTISILKIDRNFSTKDIKNIKIVNDKFYIFTRNAIYLYDWSSHKTTKIQIITPEISISDVTTINNKTILATSEGLIIKPNTNWKEEYLPKFLLNKVYVNEKPSFVKTLRYDENNISFDFSVLSFLPNSNYSIAYQINNGNWITLDENQRNIKLSSLAAGEYNIVFRIENIEKTERNTIKYNFTIQKPFWLRWYFLVLYVILIICVLWFVYKIQLKKIQKKNAIEWNKINLENNLNQSKLTAIKSQMNPHFFYNALNTIQSYILSNDKKEAITYLNKFSSLTRIILELTERNYLTIKEEINTITLYLDLEKARFNNDFNYTITVDEKIDTESIKIPTMLLQPFLENAIKHGLLHLKGNKTLTITFKKNNSLLEITIDDNGIGRKKSEELNLNNRKDHISFATNAIEKRLEILNLNKEDKITIQYTDKQQHNEPLGTTVQINLPATWK